MALIVVCGVPCSQKSFIAAAISAGLTGRGLSPVIIDEQSLNLTRAASYFSADQEKVARGALKAATERALSRNAYVVLDSVNGIKGYRYQLWCAAREVGVRYCLVHCEADLASAQAANAQRTPDQQWPPAVLQDLSSRFEVPDSKNRWEAPLWRLRAGQDASEQLQAIVATATGQAEQQPTRKLQPNLATTVAKRPSTDLLAEVDSATQSVIQAIADAQAAQPDSSPVEVTLAGSRTQLPRRMTLAELRRHKRTFVKLVTQNQFSQLSSADGAALTFLQYLTSST